MATYLPPVGFHFRVAFDGVRDGSDDLRFTEVGGLSVELATEEVPEGGENRFVQRYPLRAKVGDVVFRRGLMRRSEIWQWARACIEDLAIQPRTVTCSLLDEQHAPLATWQLVGAYPVKWSLSDFNAMNNTFVVETLALACQRLHRVGD